MGSAGMSGGMWLIPSLSMIALIVAAAATVVLATTLLRRPAPSPAGSAEARALAVAKERYARGEIDHAELDRILDTLLHKESRTDPRR
ncbi:MAG: SHOCT domain-containing protein [Streptosporangiales bacterium]|nr:SHOCT domain-containing protein [Streptosporangiales bacterium]